jgi:hypothetical protein
MFRITLLIATAVFCFSGLYAQQSKYSKVRVWAGTPQLMQMADAGLPVDHGKFKTDTWLITDYSTVELAVLDSLGITYDVLVDDVKAYYQMRLSNTPHTSHMFGDPHLRSHSRSSCSATGSGLTLNDPTNFNLGSMGGYLTYYEFLAEMDAMATLYPNLITAKAPIGTFTTWQSRPVYWLRISDNPGTDETEPEVLYTALHHAREPGSLMQLVYYMWYLLENYGTDPQVTYLVDNTEMYFVPMINPDGYVQNETTDPSGGGMWRKNMRNNGATFGVDLNRNYDYQWGGAGTSTNPASDIYLGPSPFSEPETQAMKFFFENHDFEIALNYHTYGDLLLHPFGYSTSVVAPDDDLFYAWKNIMIRDNSYANIQSSALYAAAGDSDDWAYDGDLATKPKVFAMTPEAGDDAHGFWPATAEILPLCRENVWQNLIAAELLLVYGTTADKSPNIVNSHNEYARFDITRLGLRSGNLTVSVLPSGPGVIATGSPKVFSALSINQTELDSISYTLDPSMVPGQVFSYIISISNGITQWNDTLTKVLGPATTAFADNGSTVSNWTTTQWGTSTAQFVSAPSSITDSPSGQYGNNANNIITLSNTVDLSGAVAASATFYARWDIENNYDFCQLEASTDGGTSWSPLCGRYTNSGTADQEQGEPLWDGIQNSWVAEEVDLSDFLGQTIRLRFRLKSDGFVTGDGFYFDDFMVSAAISNDITETDTPDMRIWPNPASDFVTVQVPDNASGGEIIIHDETGREVARRAIDQWRVTLSVEALAPGMYSATYVGKSGRTTIRFSVFR